MSQASPSEFTLEFELTDEMADDYARAIVQRLSHGEGLIPRHSFLILLAVVLGSLALLALFTGRLPPEVLGGVAFVLALFWFFGWLRRRMHYQEYRWAVLLPFQGLERRTVHVRFFDDQIAMELGDLHFQSGWAELGEIVVLPGFWLLRLREGGQFVIPSRGITSEIEAFLRGKAAAAGLRLQEEV